MTSWPAGASMIRTPRMTPHHQQPRETKRPAHRPPRKGSLATTAILGGPQPSSGADTAAMRPATQQPFCHTSPLLASRERAFARMTRQNDTATRTNRAKGGNTAMKITLVEPLLLDRFLYLRVNTDAGITGLADSGTWGQLEASAAAIAKYGE